MTETVIEIEIVSDVDVERDKAYKKRAPILKEKQGTFC
ncbi:hypothetical protein DFR56_10754 [Pseudogracilibacillus auburnensis]|uniref:Uncharacterized protein n=1 Tax=Pseudogracilibacillus auburnensis TaxID=1494959 RepID=A0A2V3W2P8_9BACI|nr:hypothetical protein DFR56_10754 [Pseudogracilibacillus auburnensis]